MLQKYKLVVTVPESDADRLRQVIGDAGAGTIGNYVHCSFTTKGVGRFVPKAGANPTLGKIGFFQEVIEERIEINCDDTNLDLVVKAIQENHPYEEPSIDVYKLQ